MPRNTKKNIENFQEWILKMLRGNADYGEHVSDLCNRAHKLFFLSYDKFKCNLTNPKYYLFVQDAILQRLIELNDMNYINELIAIQEDIEHYSESKILQVEEELNEIWDDTFELLTLSNSINAQYKKYKPKGPQMPLVFYSDVKQRRFKLDFDGIQNCDVGWLDWEKL